MKKLTILLLVASLMLGITACASLAAPETTTVYAPHSGDSKQTYFTTLEEIEAFAESEDAPEGFVPLEAISILGEWDNYLVFVGDYFPFLSEYEYDMVDQKGFKFALRVSHDNFTEPDTILNKTDLMTNMVRTGTEETGWIIRDGILYRYGEGNLLSIYMQIDDVQVALVYSDRFREYPVDENGNYTTYIERIVFGTDEEASAAIDEFITYFRNNR